MKLNIEFYENHHLSFIIEAKKQLTEIISVEYAAYIKTSMLYMYLGEFTKRDNGYPFYDYVDLLVGKASFGLVSRMQVFWIVEDGTIVYPSDDLKGKKIKFWIEGLISKEDFRDKIERNEYLWKRPKEENLIDKKEYKFRIKEMGWFAASFPNIGIRIKCDTDLDSLAQVIGNTIEVYNQANESEDIGSGLIHYFDSIKIKKGVYLFTIDIGSALVEGVEAILKALNTSDFNIELVTLE